MKKEPLKPDLTPEAKAAVTDLHAAGYDCEFWEREEHGAKTYKVEAAPRGSTERGVNVQIRGKPSELSGAVGLLAARLLPRG